MASASPGKPPRRGPRGGGRRRQAPLASLVRQRDLRRQRRPQCRYRRDAGAASSRAELRRRSDGRRPADVAQLGAERQVEVVDGVAAVRLQQAGHAEQRHDGHLEGQRGAHCPPKPVPRPSLARLRLVWVVVSLAPRGQSLPGAALPPLGPATGRGTGS